MNQRSAKLIAQRPKAAGINGAPNLFMARSRGRSNSKPRSARRRTRRTAYTVSVPVKTPMSAPSGPLSSTTTSSTVAAIVTSTFARVAIENWTERSSARRMTVSCV